MITVKIRDKKDPNKFSATNVSISLDGIEEPTLDLKGLAEVLASRWPNVTSIHFTEIEARLELESE